MQRIQRLRVGVVLPAVRRYKSKQISRRYRVFGSFPIGAMLIVWSSVSLAQAKPLIEEIVVTAQRIEENASKVPIAIAF